MTLEDLAVEIKDLSKKVDYIPMIIERVDNWIITTNLYREEKDKLQNRVIEEISQIRDGCIRHIGNNVEFKRHIEEHKQQKTIWSNRGFQVLMFVMTCAWGVMFFLIQSLLKSYK